MKSLIIISLFVLAAFGRGFSQSTRADSPGDTLIFSGQLSGWMNYSHGSDLPLWMGARYIPQLNYNVERPGGKLIDFEVSANANGAVALRLYDSAYADGAVRPYRAWARYSTNQFELRAGLQKINFGSASILRPLMWFEQVDPRDPLRITTGVWGVLGRYYFLNNANIWLWTLYGNKDARSWEAGRTSQRYPEFGGRFQVPLAGGEAGISFHHRLADIRDVTVEHAAYPDVPENRVGLDGKWDVGVGLWVEGAWIGKSRDVGTMTNQVILNSGMDYTFGVGNGLNATFEQLIMGYDRTAFAFSDPLFFSVLSLSYPVGLLDNVNAIFYYNWSTDQSYSLLNWKRQFSRFYIYLTAYWNPEVYDLPQQRDAGNLFSGRGVQFMLVYNH